MGITEAKGIRDSRSNERPAFCGKTGKKTRKESPNINILPMLIADANDASAHTDKSPKSRLAIPVLQAETPDS